MRERLPAFSASPRNWFSSKGDKEAQDSQDQCKGSPSEALPSARGREVHERSHKHQADKHPCSPSEDPIRQWHAPKPSTPQHDQREEHIDRYRNAASDPQGHRELPLVDSAPRSSPQRSSERQRSLEGCQHQETHGSSHGGSPDLFLCHL